MQKPLSPKFITYSFKLVSSLIPALHENICYSLPSLPACISSGSHRSFHPNFPSPLADSSQPQLQHSLTENGQACAGNAQGSRWINCRTSPLPSFLQIQSLSCIPSSAAEYLWQPPPTSSLVDPTDLPLHS